MKRLMQVVMFGSVVSILDSIFEWFFYGLS